MKQIRLSSKGSNTALFENVFAEPITIKPNAKLALASYSIKSKPRVFTQTGIEVVGGCEVQLTRNANVNKTVVLPEGNYNGETFPLMISKAFNEALSNLDTNTRDYGMEWSCAANSKYGSYELQFATFKASTNQEENDWTLSNYLLKTRADGTTYFALNNNYGSPQYATLNPLLNRGSFSQGLTLTIDDKIESDPVATDYLENHPDLIDYSGVEFTFASMFIRVYVKDNTWHYKLNNAAEINTGLTYLIFTDTPQGAPVAGRVLQYDYNEVEVIRDEKKLQLFFRSLNQTTNSGDYVFDLEYGDYTMRLVGLRDIINYSVDYIPSPFQTKVNNGYQRVDLLPETFFNLVNVESYADLAGQPPPPNNTTNIVINANADAESVLELQQNPKTWNKSWNGSVLLRNIASVLLNPVSTHLTVLLPGFNFDCYDGNQATPRRKNALAFLPNPLTDINLTAIASSIPSPVFVNANNKAEMQLNKFQVIVVDDTNTPIPLSGDNACQLVLLVDDEDKK